MSHTLIINGSIPVQDYSQVLYLVLHDTTQIDPEAFRIVVEQCRIDTVDIYQSYPEIYRLLQHVPSRRFDWFVKVGYEEWIRHLKRPVKWVNMRTDNVDFLSIGYIPDRIVCKKVMYEFSVPIEYISYCGRTDIFSVYEFNEIPSWLDLYYTKTDTPLPSRIRLNGVTEGSFEYVELTGPVIPPGLIAKRYKMTCSLIDVVRSRTIVSISFGEFTSFETTTSVPAIVDLTDRTSRVLGRMEGTFIHFISIKGMPSEGKLREFYEACEKHKIRTLYPSLSDRLLMHDIAPKPWNDPNMARFLKQSYANILLVMYALRDHRLPPKTYENLLSYMIGPVTGQTSSTALHIPVVDGTRIEIQAGTRVAMNGIDYYIYSLSKQLGRGDDGTVYVASTEFGPRAVKAIHKVSKDSRNEIWAVEKLVKNPHPLVLRYFGTVNVNRRHYIAMELCDGSLSSPPEPPIHSGTVYLTQLFKALHHIHSLGIAHCDVCNINVLWKGAGCAELRLADFGWSHNRDTEPQLDYERLFYIDWMNAGYMLEEMGWISVNDVSFIEKSRSVTNPILRFERMFLEGITIS
jgi:hypothetical protein